ncbi:hypothetical protein [Streptomyces sp. NPDC059072]|uniref:trypsin-like serine peptidase n=1 Tax=Streptomyces sp. NPDC059072 TaxID=3346715 RepID=UPI0036ADD746
MLLLTAGGVVAHAAPTPQPSGTVTAPVATPSTSTTASPGATPSTGATPSRPATPGTGTTASNPPASAKAPSPTPPPASPSPVAPTGGAGDWTDEDAIKFWTPERMKSAVDPGRPSAAAVPSVGSSLLKPPSLSASGMPTAEHFLGAKSVGTIFTYDTTDPGTGQARAYGCSASVVDSPGHNLILTAGHCSGGKAVFVPWYRSEYTLENQTYGFYRINAADWYVDKNYVHNSKAAISDVDYAHVTMVGYPKAAHNPERHPVRCPVKTEALPGFYQMRAECAGMWGGVSGGPWFSKINWDTGTGEIIGNVGGYYGGGMDVPDSDPRYNQITYSPLHGDHFFRLYADAKAGRHVDYGPYQQPPLPYSMGDGELWKHARLMASGEYTGDGKGDLIVLWTDGEITLYTGDGTGGFAGERLLAAADGLWKEVKSLTGGDFAGGIGSDLLMVWNSGEVKVFPDVGSNGVGGGVQLAGAGSVWKYADQIVGGNFGTPNHVTDLLVRWSDGEVTNHTMVGGDGLGIEHQLRKPDDAWRNATLVTAGDFTGNANWDTLIRWSDGRVVQYRDTSPSALGSETQMAPPQSVWTHDTVMTAGSYDPNGWPDDLVIRWSDGETTMYLHTGATFGDERTLVNPV